MLSDNLKKAREELGLSQTAVAKKLEITRQAYNHYETGKRTPSVDVLNGLGELLHVSVDYLLNSTDGTHYIWDNTDIMDTIKDGLDVFFQNVLAATRNCTNQDQKMVFDIMTQLWSVLPQYGDGNDGTTAALSLQQTAMVLSTQFYDACFRATTNPAFGKDRVDALKQSYVEQYDEALTSLQRVFLPISSKDCSDEM